MASHEIHIFGTAKPKGFYVYPFGSEIAKQQRFISPQLHPFIKNGINLKFLACGFSHTMIIHNYKEIIEFGTIDAPNAKEIPTIDKWYWKFNEILDVKAGYDYTVVLTSDNVAYSWGFTESGRLGLESASESIEIPTAIKLKEVTKIELASCTTYLLTSMVVLFVFHVSNIMCRKWNFVCLWIK